MIDLEGGCVSCAVLSLEGIRGIGDKLFAVPWDAMRVDTERKAVVLDIDRERLEKAPGFDKDNWPGAVDRDWMLTVYRIYGSEPYWQERERMRH